MKVEIISISTKLLLGEILDTHTPYVSRTLREMNADLTCKVVVGDDLEMVANTLETAFKRAEIVLIIGGLGDGAEELIVKAAAQVTGRELTAQFPGLEGAQPLGLSYEQPAGFLLEDGRGTLIYLPGKRREIGYLLETEALPYLNQQIRAAEPHLGWTLLRTVGIMESSLKERLADLELGAGHRITYDTFAGQTNVRLWVESTDERQVEQELDALSNLITTRLGDHIYGFGEDRLEDVVIQLLIQRKCTLTLTECYTENILTNMFTSALIPNEIMTPWPATTWQELCTTIEAGELTSQTDLVQWCRDVSSRILVKSGTDLSLLIYKNVNKGGVHLIVTLASSLGISTTRRSFGGHPENINQWAATLGMAHLRRWLVAQK